MNVLALIGLTIAGTTVGCLTACVPSLHVYSVIALAAAWLHHLAAGGSAVPHEAVVALMGGAIAGWAVAGAIPSILLAAPDESAVLTVLPGQTYAMEGRGFDAVMITAAGSLFAAIFLVAGVAPLAPALLGPLREVMRPHDHWVIWAAIVFLLMSEWPKLGSHGQGGWRRFADGWITTGAGLLTFLLAGLLGFVLRYKSPVSPDVAYQGLMPAFTGLFALPWLILNIASRTELPEQTLSGSAGVSPRLLFRGTAVGTTGGLFAALSPGLTGGVGALLAGHASAQRDSRIFLVSQGASRAAYYMGALLLFFVPGVGFARGSGSWMIRQFHEPQTWSDYYVAIAVLAIAACVAFLLTAPLARATIRLSAAIGYRRISVIAAAGAVLLVWATTGIGGLAVMTVATGIGLIPVLFHSRRLNCLGVIMLPAACSMSGIAPAVARAMGLTN